MWAIIYYQQILTTPTPILKHNYQHLRSFRNWQCLHFLGQPTLVWHDETVQVSRPGYVPSLHCQSQELGLPLLSTRQEFRSKMKPAERKPQLILKHMHSRRHTSSFLVVFYLVNFSICWCFACTYVYVPQVCPVSTEPEEVLGSSGTDILWVWDTVDAGDWTPVPWKICKSRNCWAISSVILLVFLRKSHYAAQRCPMLLFQRT